MELADEPKSWVEEARNRVKRISDLDPKDRLDIVYGIGLCCSTLAKSMQGWMQWIGNLSLKDFEQRELEEIFGIIKKATVQLMELDIDKTSKYEESHGLRQKPKRRIVLVAEFSIHPIGVGTSVGRYVKAAVRAMSKIPGLTVDVTPMSSVLEAASIGTILEAVEVSHRALRSMGARRISSSLRIDERLDKRRTMSDKVRGLKRSTSPKS